MKQLKHWLHHTPHPYDPATWPRAILGFGFVLVALWMSFGMRMVWAQSLGAPHAGSMQLLAGSHAYDAINLANHAEITITGMHAKVILTQVFKNTTELWVEGIYSFPLPDDAAVHAMRMVIGSRVVEGVIKERETAKKLYTQAKNAGKQAALTEQERPNLFTQSVANIGPNETVEVTLEYIQTVHYDMGQFSLRLPTTLTPRYIPGISALSDGEIPPSETFQADAFGWASPTGAVPDAHRITPPQGHRSNAISITVELHSGFHLDFIRSDTHDITTQLLDQTHYRVELTQGSAVMNKDFELVWQPEYGQAPQASIFTEQGPEGYYHQVVFLPPNNSNPSNLARALTLIIDTSGSMAGESIVQAKASVLAALDRLSPDDSFNVIEFNSHYTPLFSQPTEANAANLQRARKFVRALNADGGTEMSGALRAALAPNQEHNERVSQVVFITDGAVGNEQGLFQLITQMLGNTRLFTVGIGSAPNSHFMRKAAQFGRGTFTHISTPDQVAERMDQLLSKLESPVLKDLNIQWPVKVEMYPQNPPDLYLSEPLMITGFSKTLPSLPLTVSGDSAGTSWQRHFEIHSATRTEQTENPGVLAKTWARQKLDSQLDAIQLYGETESTKAAALNTALTYGLLSPYTSFVAIAQEPVRANLPPDTTVPVPNALPSGSQFKPVGYPQTSAGLYFHLLAGALAFCALLVLGRVRSRP